MCLVQKLNRAGVWPVSFVVVSFWRCLQGWKQEGSACRCISSRGWGWSGRKCGGGCMQGMVGVVVGSMVEG